MQVLFEVAVPSHGLFRAAVAVHDDLHREKRGADRRVVGAGDAGGCAAGYQDSELARRHSQTATQERCDRGRKQNHRPLPSDRSRRGNGQQ